MSVNQLVTDEVLDLVDEEDRVIGEVLKSEAHRNPSLIHRIVGGLLYDGRRRVLLQKRSSEKFSDPGLWMVSWSGHVSKGATPLETAHKELKEELGFDTRLVFVERIKWFRPDERQFGYFFLGRYQGQDIKLDHEESADARFFSESEFNNLLASGQFCEKVSELMVRRFWAGEFDKFL